MKECLPLTDLLRRVGLRPTRQRLALAGLLFEAGDCHASAESLWAQAEAAQVRVSLATVYNTLRQFQEAGILRRVISLEGEVAYFDTNCEDHLHFYCTQTKTLRDFPASGVTVSGLPPLPEGTELDRIDIVVRTRPVTARPGGSTGA